MSDRETGAKTMSRPKLAIETRPCGRCGGTGHYSYNTMHGSMCYGCQGQKNVPTPAGRKARAALDAYLTEHATVAASELKPGDRIKNPHGRGWMTVTDVTTDFRPLTGTWFHGDTSGCQYGTTTVHTKRTGWQGPAHRPVVRSTPEVWDGYYTLAATLKGVTLIEQEVVS